MDIPVKLQSSKTIIVSSKESAKTLGSGGLEVFATPAMIALMENVALEMIRPYLNEGTDSVGTLINAKHLKASPIGAKIMCCAKVESVSVNKVSFKITCSDDKNEIIGEAEHERFVVDIDRFLSKLETSDC